LSSPHLPINPISRRIVNAPRLKPKP